MVNTPFSPQQLAALQAANGKLSNLSQEDFDSVMQTLYGTSAAPAEPQREIGDIEASFRGEGSRYLTAAGGLAQQLGSDTLAGYLNDAAQYVQPKGYQSPEWYDIPDQIQSQTAPILESMGGAYLGAAGGAAIGSAVPVVGTAIGAGIGGLIGMAMPTVISSFGGNLQRQQEEAGAGNGPVPLSDPRLNYTRATLAAAGQGTTEAVLGRLGPAYKFLKGMGIKTAGSILGNSLEETAKKLAAAGVTKEAAPVFAKKVLQGMATEGVTEPIQQAMEIWQANPDKLYEFSPDVQYELLNAALAGMVAGGVLEGSVGYLGERSQFKANQRHEAEVEKQKEAYRQQLQQRYEQMSQNVGQAAQDYADEVRPLPGLPAPPNEGAAGEDRVIPMPPPPSATVPTERVVMGSNERGIFAIGKDSGQTYAGPFGSATDFETYRAQHEDWIRGKNTATQYSNLVKTGAVDKANQLLDEALKKHDFNEQWNNYFANLREAAKNNIKTANPAAVARDMAHQAAKEGRAFDPLTDLPDNLLYSGDNPNANMTSFEADASRRMAAEKGSNFDPLADLPDELATTGQTKGAGRQAQNVETPRVNPPSLQPTTPNKRFVVREMPVGEDQYQLKLTNKDGKTKLVGKPDTKANITRRMDMARRNNKGNTYEAALVKAAPTAHAVIEQNVPNGPNAQPVNERVVSQHPNPQMAQVVADKLAAGQNLDAATEAQGPATPTAAEVRRGRVQTTQDALQAETQRMAGDTVGVKAVDLINAGGPNDLVEGIYSSGPDGQRLIQISTSVYDPKLTVEQMLEKALAVHGHEMVHHVKSLGLFSEAEWSTLVEAAKLAKMPGLNKLSFLDAAAIQNENVAGYSVDALLSNPAERAAIEKIAGPDATEEQLRAAAEKHRQSIIEEEAVANLAAAYRKNKGVLPPTVRAKGIPILNKFFNLIRKLLRMAPKAQKYVATPNAAAGVMDAFYSGEIGNRTGQAQSSPQDIERFSIAARQTQMGIDEFKRWFNQSVIVDEDGKPLRMFHGALKNFDIFDPSAVNPESFMGQALYFSSDPSDASDNYANLSGPDRKHTINRMVDEMENEFYRTNGRDPSPDETAAFEAQARARIADHEGAVLPVYLSVQNPAIISKTGGTKLDNIPRFMKAFDKAIASMDFVDKRGADRIKGIATERIMDEGSMPLSDLHEAIVMFSDASDEQMRDAGPELFRRTVEAMGYDGIVDKLAGERWSKDRFANKLGVFGTNPTTTHVLVFKPEQVKSIFNEFSEGAATSNRFSAIATQSPQEKAQTLKEAMRYFGGDKVEADLDTLSDPNSTSTIVMMTPDEYLAAATPGLRNRGQENIYAENMDRGMILDDLPMLGLIGNNKWRVQQHEGRHRAAAFKKLGFTYVPVRIETEGYAWGSEAPRPTEMAAQYSGNGQIAVPDSVFYSTGDANERTATFLKEMEERTGARISIGLAPEDKQLVGTARSIKKAEDKAYGKKYEMSAKEVAEIKGGPDANPERYQSKALQQIMQPVEDAAMQAGAARAYNTVATGVFGGEASEVSSAFEAVTSQDKADQVADAVAQQVFTLAKDHNQRGAFVAKSLPMSEATKPYARPGMTLYFYPKGDGVTARSLSEVESIIKSLPGANVIGGYTAITSTASAKTNEGYEAIRFIWIPEYAGVELGDLGNNYDATMKALHEIADYAEREGIASGNVEWYDVLLGSENNYDQLTSELGTRGGTGVTGEAGPWRRDVGASVAEGLGQSDQWEALSGGRDWRNNVPNQKLNDEVDNLSAREAGSQEKLFNRFAAVAKTAVADRNGSQPASIVMNRLKEVGFVPDKEILAILGEYPDYLDTIADFMVTQRKKVVNGKLTPRDLMKAYFMTVSSQGAGAMNPDIIQQKTGFKVPKEFLESNGQVRPEDAAAAWLMSKRGQAALDALANGKFVVKLWQQGFEVRRAFGDDRFKTVNFVGGIKSLADVTRKINEAKGDVNVISKAVMELNGIGVGKQGFIKHLFGFGDSPTIDAVELNTWIAGQGDVRKLDTERAQLARDVKSNFSNKSLGEYVASLIDKGFNRIRKKSADAAAIDPSVFKHIMHHWLWDRAKGTETKHVGMYTVMARYSSFSSNDSAQTRIVGPEKDSSFGTVRIDGKDRKITMLRGFHKDDGRYGPVGFGLTHIIKQHGSELHAVTGKSKVGELVTQFIDDMKKYGAKQNGAIRIADSYRRGDNRFLVQWRHKGYDKPINIVLTPTNAEGTEFHVHNMFPADSSITGQVGQEQRFSAVSPAYQSVTNKIMGTYQEPKLLDRLAAKFIGMELGQGDTWRRAMVRNFVNSMEGAFNLDWAKQLATGQDGLPITNESAGKMLELATQYAGRAEAILRFGPLTFDKATGDIRISQNNPGLIDIFSPLNIETEKEAWGTYAIARREQDYRASHPGKTLTKMTDADIALVLAQAPAHFGQVFEAYQNFNDDMVQFALDTGILDQQKADDFRALAYVPLYRMMGKVDPKTGEVIPSSNPMEDWEEGITRSLNNPGAPFAQKIKGSQRGVGDIIENIMRNNMNIVKSGLANVALNRVAQNIDDVNAITNKQGSTSKFGYQIFNAKQGKGKHVMKFRKDGKLVQYAINDMPLWYSIINLSPSQHGAIVKSLSAFSDILRKGVTLMPSFMLANIYRGQMETFVKTDMPLTAIGPALRGAKDVWQGGKITQLLKAETGIGGYNFGREISEYSQALEKGVRAKNRKAGINGDLLQTWKDRFGQVLEGIEKVGEATEMAQRIALMEHLIGQGMSEKDAAYEAMNVINYGRRGAGVGLLPAMASNLIPMIPFLNARIQGLYRLFENQKGSQQGWFTLGMPKEVFLRGLVLTGISTMIYGMFSNDDRWDDERLDRKVNYDIIYVGDRTIYLPRPFEVGSIFGTIPTLFYDAVRKQQGREFANGLAMLTFNTFGLNPVPQGVKPVLEAYTNFNMFTGGPIESQALQVLRAGDRANERTSAIAKIIGAQINFSPVKIDHLINGYLGSFGSTLLGVTDGVIESTGLIPSRPKGIFGDPIGTVSDLAGFGRFSRADADRAGRMVQDLYDAKSYATAAYRQMKEAQLAHDVNKARKIMEENRSYLAARKSLDNYGEALTKVNRMIRSIANDPNLPAAEKKQRIDQLHLRKQAIAKAANKIVAPLTEW